MNFSGTRVLPGIFPFLEPLPEKIKGRGFRASGAGGGFAAALCPRGAGGARRHVGHHRTWLCEAVGTVYWAGGRAGASRAVDRFFKQCKAKSSLPGKSGQNPGTLGKSNRTKPGFFGKALENFPSFSGLFGFATERHLPFCCLGKKPGFCKCPESSSRYLSHCPENPGKL